MNPRVRNTVLWCVGFVILVIGLSFYKYSGDSARLPSPETLQQQGLVLLPRPRAVEPFELIDHKAQRFNNDNLKGHWSVLFFGFTNCPDICPVTLSTLARSIEHLADPELASRIKVYLVSVDPERDTPDKLNQYVNYFSPDFIGLTGQHKKIARLAGQVGIAFAKVPHDGLDGYTVDHSGQIIIFNPKGHFHAFLKSPHESTQIAWFLKVLITHFERTIGAWPG